MHYYKQSPELDETCVHGDLSVIVSECIDFFATVLTFKVHDKRLRGRRPRKASIKGNELGKL